MTDATLPAGRFTPGEFRIGHVFSRTWWVFSRNFFPFVLVTLVASVPSLLMPRPTPGVPVNPFQNVGASVAAFLLLIVLGTLAQAVVLYSAFQVMRGRPVDLAESARIGLRRFFPVVGLGIIMPIIIGLASILLLFPGLMLYMMWFVATPICVVEQLGPFDSMGRSRELTKGHRWQLFGMLLLIFIPVFIIGAIIGVIAVATMGSAGIASLSAGLATTVGQIVNVVWSAIWTAFFAILIVVTYHDLRVAKEGIDTDQIAAVFE